VEKRRVEEKEADESLAKLVAITGKNVEAASLEAEVPEPDTETELLEAEDPAPFSSSRNAEHDDGRSLLKAFL